MESLTLEQIYFVGQTISAIAVVLSLIYVGFQIKQNTTATQTASAQAHVNAHTEFVGLINSSSTLADVLHQGANGISALKEGDIIRYMSFHDLAFVSFQSSHLQWITGSLNDALWGTYKQAFIDTLQQKGPQEWWALRRHRYDQEFQDYVDEAVTKEVGKPMHPGAMED